MRQLYKCEICGYVSDKKSDVDNCEIRHLQSCIEDLNKRAEIAKQHNLKFVQTYSPVIDKYIWTLEEIKMKRQIYSGTLKAGNMIKNVFELTIRINGQKERTFVFKNEDDFVIEQTNNWFTVYFNKKVIIAIKLTMLDYMYTGWRFI